MPRISISVVVSLAELLRNNIVTGVRDTVTLELNGGSVVVPMIDLDPGAASACISGDNATREQYNALLTGVWDKLLRLCPANCSVRTPDYLCDGSSTGLPGVASWDSVGGFDKFAHKLAFTQYIVKLKAGE